MHINLVWDKWLDTPLPNGLHPKYYPEWHTKWKNNYSTNVLTRFVPLDRYNLGFFPLLLSSASITYSDIEVDKAVDNQLNWYVMEPNHMDLSLIVENMFGNISEQAIEKMKTGTIKLVLYYAYEAFPLNQVNWMNTVERSLGWLGIPPESVIFIFGDQNLGANMEYLSTQPNFYNWHFGNAFVFDHFGWEFSDYCKNLVGKFGTDELVVPIPATRDNKRNKKFLCLNGGGRPHRKWLMTELKRNNLLEEGYVSYLNKFDIPYQPEEFVWYPTVRATGDRTMIDMLEYHHKHGNSIEERLLDVDASQDAWHNRGMTASHYADSYFNVTSETWPAEPSFFVTEKIFKPIVNLQPFIIVGHPGLLAYLKDKGFETYPEWFNEEYDGIKDHKKRLHMVMENIKRVSSYSHDELHEMYKKSWDKLLRNRQRFFDYNWLSDFNELVEAMKKI